MNAANLVAAAVGVESLARGNGRRTVKRSFSRGSASRGRGLSDCLKRSGASHAGVNFMKVARAVLVIVCLHANLAFADDARTFCGKTLDGWIAALRTGSAHERSSAAFALSYYGPMAKDAVPDLGRVSATHLELGHSRRLGKDVCPRSLIYPRRRLPKPLHRMCVADEPQVGGAVSGMLVGFSQII
jgi:hypothetical protein